MHCGPALHACHQAALKDAAPRPRVLRPQPAATCYGGRNRLVAREYVAAVQADKPESFAELEVRRGSASQAGAWPLCASGQPATLGRHSRAALCHLLPLRTHKRWPSLRDAPAPPCPTVQARLLGGQKLQGVLTSNEVQAILQRRDWEADYPLFTTGGCRQRCRSSWAAWPPDGTCRDLKGGASPRASWQGTGRGAGARHVYMGWLEAVCSRLGLRLACQLVEHRPIPGCARSTCAPRLSRPQ